MVIGHIQNIHVYISLGILLYGMNQNIIHVILYITSLWHIIKLYLKSPRHKTGIRNTQQCLLLTLELEQETRGTTAPIAEPRTPF